MTSEERVSLSSFIPYLHDHREALFQRWLERIRDGHVPSAEGLGDPQLRDHVPELLERIFRALAGQPTPSVEAEAKEHGRQRWSTGYDIDEVVRELLILRDILLEVIEEYAEGDPGLSRADESLARCRILGVIDRTGQSSVAQFHANALAVRRLLWGELESANRQLKTANEEKDRFLAMLSHELRNPLAPILTAVQLLELNEATDPRVRRAREVIERQVRHQTRLIDDLLDVSRIAQGKIALRLEPHNIKAAIAYAVEGALPAISAKNQELRVELPEEPLPVQADPVRMEQVITNLLTNANRYTDPGGTIWLSAAAVDGEALIRVRDTGDGISPLLLPRIFDLFTQGETTRSRQQCGLGIGLALVNKLVELHGGIVEAFSDGPGQGSEFVVRLPLMASQSLAETLRSAGPEIGRQTLNVVLVEDSDDARMVMADLLESLGYGVVTAAEGSEALRLAREHAATVFVIDIGLPGMDGYEVARRLRRLPDGQQLVLIALTGYAGPEATAAAHSAGFDTHLTKPANIDELDRLLSQAVSGR
jgi:two-component system CheB/CheR fusion protein